MDVGWEFFWSVVASSAGTAALLGIAAFLGRRQISHWLSKDLEKIKAGHQRELEAYKVTLIAETEKIKASQDVKKASALRALDKKFDALDRYHKAVAGFRTHVHAMAMQPADFKTIARWDALSARLDGLADAENALDLFCDGPRQQTLISFRKGVMPYMEHCLPGKPPLAGQELSDITTASVQAGIAVTELIEQMTAEMQELV